MKLIKGHYFCANCGKTDQSTLWDEKDTVYCSVCCHRTRVSDGKDDLVVCPVCHHLRDRKAAYCQWCNAPIGDNKFSQSSYETANEFEKTIDRSNLRYYSLKGKRKV